MFLVVDFYYIFVTVRAKYIVDDDVKWIVRRILRMRSMASQNKTYVFMMVIVV